MIDAGRGAVVHVSSIQRTMPLFDSTLGYAAAKAAITGAEHSIDGGTVRTT
jgi:NAD(P)-dependent dehydrogenase (short-subunit alcohol dehydrogenase family)